jgi:hypothetical protein
MKQFVAPKWFLQKPDRFLMVIPDHPFPKAKKVIAISRCQDDPRRHFSQEDLVQYVQSIFLWHHHV